MRFLPVRFSTSTLVTVAPKLIPEPSGTGMDSILIWEAIVNSGGDLCGEGCLVTEECVGEERKRMGREEQWSCSYKLSPADEVLTSEKSDSPTSEGAAPPILSLAVILWLVCPGPARV